MVELEQICEVAGRKMVQSFEGQQQQFILGTMFVGSCMGVKYEAMKILTNLNQYTYKYL